ncbi:MAG: hypothetical protein ABSD74_20805 [Rhizomicrobium sp.]|jgi:tRNA 2-selenouridine synthase SelU
MRHQPYIPEGIGGVLDYLAHMLFASPTFRDKTGYLPEENIDTTFCSLNEGLLAIRKALGEERYAALTAMSDKMRALFEVDPDDTTGETRAGHTLIQEMEDILTTVAKHGSSK